MGVKSECPNSYTQNKPTVTRMNYNNVICDVYKSWLLCCCKVGESSHFQELFSWFRQRQRERTEFLSLQTLLKQQISQQNCRMKPGKSGNGPVSLTWICVLCVFSFALGLLFSNRFSPLPPIFILIQFIYIQKDDQYRTVPNYGT